MTSSAHTSGINKAIAIFSDASFCLDTGAAAGAYWIRSGEVQLSAGYRLKGGRRSNDAEILAACKSIDAAIAHPVLFDRLRQGARTHLLLYVDCMSVARVFVDECSIQMSAPAQKAVEGARHLIAQLGFNLKVVHVKGHSGVDTPQKRHNDWCDKRSRRCLNSIRGTVCLHKGRDNPFKKQFPAAPLVAA